jgi:hypothetical protein
VNWLPTQPSIVLPLLYFSLPLLLLLVFIFPLRPFSFVVHPANLFLPFLYFSSYHQPTSLVHLPFSFSHLSWNSFWIHPLSFLFMFVSFGILLQLLLPFGFSPMLFFSPLIPLPPTSLYISLEARGIDLELFSSFLPHPLKYFPLPHHLTTFVALHQRIRLL